jgi:hypothetical protein
LLLLSLLRFKAPKTKQKRGVNRRATQNKRSGDGRSTADMSIFASSHRGGPALRVTVPDDMKRQAISTVITQSPPKNLRSMINWMTQNITIVAAQSVSSTGDTEVNFAFKLTDVSNFASWSALYDQYCIYAVSVSIAVTSSADAFSGTQGRLTTAIDFDNSNNLGSEALVQQYITADTVEISPNLVVQRFIKPCVKSAVFNNTTSTNGAVGRLWIDSNAQAISHYGLRSYWRGNSESSLTADYIATYCVGFRNVQ